MFHREFDPLLTIGSLDHVPLFTTQKFRRGGAAILVIIDQQDRSHLGRRNPFSKNGKDKRGVAGFLISSPPSTELVGRKRCRYFPRP